MALISVILPSTMFMSMFQSATPKDGRPLVLRMVTSIVSAITGIEVRRDVAMTGEIAEGSCSADWWFERKITRGNVRLKTVLIPRKMKGSC